LSLHWLINLKWFVKIKKKISLKKFEQKEKGLYICTRIQGIPDEASGEMAEWSNAAVLKTVDC
jgi:hypothetical protein